MTVQISLIGLGKIGTSVGLALARHGSAVHRTGHDKQPEHARHAHKLGALDKIAYNLPASVREADLVLLALPIDQIEETLRYIAADLKESAVVMDTAPAKQALAAWARELLPPQRYYVGLTPMLHPQYLHGLETGPASAREDLFAGSLIGISAPSGTPSGALKLAADLTHLLGAAPLFLDCLEADGLMAAVHLAPQLAAAALAAALFEQPGWPEARKLAGLPFAHVTAPLTASDPPAALARAATLNREHMIRILDQLTGCLQAVRQEIASGNEAALTARLSAAHAGRLNWWEQKTSRSWASEQLPEVNAPTAGAEMRRWVFGQRRGGG